MCVGDLIEGYTDDQGEIDKERAELASMLGRLRMPFFMLPGNHDNLTNALAADWQPPLRAVLLLVRLQERPLPHARHPGQPRRRRL